MLLMVATALAAPQWTMRTDLSLNGPTVSLQAELPTRDTDLLLSLGVGGFATRPGLDTAAGRNLTYRSMPIGIGTQGRFKDMPDWFGWRVALTADIPGAVAATGPFLEEVRRNDGSPELGYAIAAVAFPLGLDARLRFRATDAATFTVGPNLRYAVFGLTLAENQNQFWAPLFVPLNVGLDIRVPRPTHRRRHRL